MRRNAGFLLAARVVSASTTLVVLALIARLRGPDVLGAVGVGFALGSIAAAVSDAGIGSLLVREAARRPAAAREILGAGLLVRLITIPTMLTAVAAGGAIVSPDAVPTIVLVAAGLVAQQTAELTRSVFNAGQRMTISGTHSILENVTWLAAIAGGLTLGWSVEATFTLALGVFVGSLVAGLILTARIAGVTPAVPDHAAVRRLIRLAAPFVAFQVVGVAASRLDTFLVGALASGAQLATAGAYFAATRIVAAFEYVPDAVSRAAYPEFARRTADAGSDVVPLLGRAASTLLVLGAAVPAVLPVAAGTVMGVVYGPALAAGGWVLGAIAFAVPFRFLGYLYGVTLTSADAQGRRVLAGAAGLAVVVAVDVPLIPVIGLAAPVGAAVATGVLIVSMYGFFVRRRFGSLGLDPVLVGSVLVAALAASSVGLVARPVVGDVPAAALAAIGYGAVVAAGPARLFVRSILRPATGQP